jgi:GNAT superfamily N-acetyltransferase
MPDDWQIELIFYLENYSKKLSFYGIYEEGNIVGGGVIFVDIYPEEKKKNIALDRELISGNPYLGFFWITEQQRKKGFGSFFLEEIQKAYSQKGLWLVCAERLNQYYQKKGFYVIDTWIDREENEKQFLMKMEEEKKKTQ